MRKAGFALIALVASSTVEAGVITQIDSFQLSTSFLPGAGAAADAVFAFDAFDPALGSLTQVDVAIQGTVSVVGELPFSQVCTIGGCIPQPFLFDLTIEHDYGLQFLSPGPQIRYSGLAPGVPIPFGSVTTYSHSMSFNDITDLIGFAPVSSSATPGAPIGPAPAVVIPAIGSARDRNDFISPIPGTQFPLVFLFPILEFSAQGQGLGPPFQGQIVSTGSITLTYLFEAPAVPTPEPLGGLLIALGLVLLRLRTGGA
jgi:hypothetical protein